MSDKYIPWDRVITLTSVILIFNKSYFIDKFYSSGCDGDGDVPKLLGGNDSDDDVGQPNESDTAPAMKSTNMPIKPRPQSQKKKLQEEEFNVMKGLASSIAKEGKKRTK